MTVYKNASSIGSHAFTNPNYNRTDALLIGADQSASLTGFVPGIIDDVRIYNRALSAQEVAQLYAMGQATIAHSNTVALSNGLVGYWPLDGNTTSWTSGTTQDASGNGNTGTLVGMSTTTSPVPGRIGQALKFNGSSQYSNLGNPTALQITGAITLSAWVNFSSFPTANNGCVVNCAAIIEKGYNGTTESYFVRYFYDGSTKKLQAGSFTGSTSFVTSWTINFSLNSWHLVTGEYDGVNWVLYVDGVKMSSTAAASGALATSVAASIGGASISGSFTRFFPGTIDDVRIYNRALSAQEVAQLYAMGQATIAHSNTVALSNGLVGYWPLDGNTTSWTSGTTQDASGSGNTGQLIKMSTTTSSTPGKIGQALKFNGSNQCITVGSSLSVQAQNKLTIAGWIYPKSFANYNALIYTNDSNSGWWLQTLTPGDTGAGRVRFGAGGSFINSAFAIPVNQWSFLVGTFDGINYKLYINGTLNAAGGSSGFAISDSRNCQIDRGRCGKLPRKPGHKRLFGRHPRLQPSSSRRRKFSSSISWANEPGPTRHHRSRHRHPGQHRDQHPHRPHRSSAVDRPDRLRLINRSHLHGPIEPPLPASPSKIRDVVPSAAHHVPRARVDDCGALLQARKRRLDRRGGAWLRPTATSLVSDLIRYIPRKQIGVGRVLKSPPGREKQVIVLVEVVDRADIESGAVPAANDGCRLMKKLGPDD